MAQKQVKYPRVVGTKDILPNDHQYYDHFQTSLDKIADYYGYDKIMVPMLENKKLQRVYKKISKGKKVIAAGTGILSGILRSDLSLSILRAYWENDLTKRPHPVRLYSSGAQYYIDKHTPRQYTEKYLSQFQIIGTEKTIADAIHLQMATELLKDLKLKKFNVYINCFGDTTSREDYRKAIAKFIRTNSKNLCKDCGKLVTKNVFDIFACDKTRCGKIIKDVPNIEEFLSDESKEQYKTFKEYLEEAGIDYIIDKSLLNFPDYYSGPVFQIKVDDTVLVEGGRHDYLMKYVGNKPRSSASFSLDIEKILHIIKEINPLKVKKKNNLIFLAHLGDKAKAKGLKAYGDLVRAGLVVREALVKDTLRSQLILADKFNAKWLLIIGQKEALDDTIIVKEVKSGIQQIITMKSLAVDLKQMLKKF